jgi:histidine triad (HIT) family protein
VTRLPDCIFCQIAAGEAPAHRVLEDDRVLVFLDLFPAAEGHTLIITKQHFENVFEASERDLAAVAERSRSVARAIRQVLRPDGLGVFQLNGAAAGQTVFHYHMHLIPRKQGEALSIHGRQRGDPQRLQELAQALAAALEGAG